MRKRSVITVGELLKHLSLVNKSVPVFLAPSMLNLDESQATQEFIDWERKVKCVSLEYCSKEIVLGWEEK